MRHALRGLAANLLAGLRLALFRRVDLGAFRLDVAAWLLVVVASALIDIVLDGLRAAPGASFSWSGLDGELYATGLLMVTSALIAAAARDARAFLALPIVVLASFPLLQLVHAAPAIAGLEPSGVTALAFEGILFAWMLALCVRSVYVACTEPVGRRGLRAVAGGILLSAPLWFSPLGGPASPWWDEGDDDGNTQEVDVGPASEAVLTAQGTLLDDALDALEDERPGITDLYFVGFAPDRRQQGFRTEVEDVQHALDERHDTRGRSLVLVNSLDTLTELPYATVSNLRSALKEIGEAIDADDDVVMLYLTAADTDEHGLAAVHPPLDLLPLTPTALRQLLQAAGIRYAVVVVASCAAGPWLDTLADDDTAVLVSSPGTTRAQDCSGGDQPSPFARQLEAALRENAPLADALRRVAGDGGEASRGRLAMGARIEQQLARLGRSAAVKSAALRVPGVARQAAGRLPEPARREAFRLAASHDAVPHMR